MGYPLEITENIVGWFLPPACREEVLGDLYERHANAVHYALSAAAVAPRVILSQIRRNTDPLVFLMTACAIGYSFAAGSAGAAFENNPLLLLRVAIPAVTAILVLILRNGYAEPEARRQRAITFDIVIAMGAAAFTQIILLAIFRSDLLLPHWWPSQGTALGWMFVILLRGIFPPQMSDNASRREGLTR